MLRIVIVVSLSWVVLMPGPARALQEVMPGVSPMVVGLSQEGLEEVTALLGRSVEDQLIP